MATADDLATGNAPDSAGWRFDDSVTQSFEDMLERSIPQYEVMRRAVTEAACWLLDRTSPSPPPLVVDLGASRGSAIAPIIARTGVGAHYLALEISDPMLAVLRERFEKEIGLRCLDVRSHDLRTGLPRFNGRPPTVILSVLTLQFVPIEYRQRILRDAYRALDWNGALILVEKVLGATADLDALEVDLYYGVKRGNGYTQEAIDRKRLSLEGVLVPLPAAVNESLLSGAGFAQVDQVWSWMNFRAWIALKG